MIQHHCIRKHLLYILRGFVNIKKMDVGGWVGPLGLSPKNGKGMFFPG